MDIVRISPWLWISVPLAGLALLGWTFVPQPLALTEAAPLTVPLANPPPELRIAALDTGKMLSQAAFAYRGGPLGEPRDFSMSALVVEHPKGWLLIDSGFGRDVDAHFKTTPALMQATSKYEKHVPAGEQLKTAGVDPHQLMGVVLTHAHWDHVSGLPDLAGAPVWVTQAEKDFIDGGEPMTALVRSFGALPYKVYDFPNGPYLGFEHSYDVYGDGSVVLVPAPGHTPGSIVAFVATPDGRRYAFVGDMVWQAEGVKELAEKPWISRRMVDKDEAAVRGLIVRMHQIQQAMPELLIVPAHDARVWARLPKLATQVPVAKGE